MLPVKIDPHADCEDGICSADWKCEECGRRVCDACATCCRECGLYSCPKCSEDECVFCGRAAEALADTLYETERRHYR